MGQLLWLQKTMKLVKGQPSSNLSRERLCRRFSLSQIKSATRNFNDELVIGKGSFGKVYKGLIDNGSKIVAMKRLDSTSDQGAKEFLMEIETLSNLRHFHLVSLIGYCQESKEMILVYEYMPRGTLADYLYGNSGYDPLTWEQRLKICIGAASGLEYLHTGTEPGVIHRDVKATNILLDENFEAKVSDFGLSRLAKSRLLQGSVTTNVKGTFGYIDPHYFITYKVSKRSDVFSFGVLMLVVLCGRKAVDEKLPEDQIGIVWWAQGHIEKGGVDQIIDVTLREQISSGSLQEFVEIANQCLHEQPSERPTMRQVVASLELALKNYQQLNAPPIPQEDEAVSHFPNLEQTPSPDSEREGMIIGGGPFHEELPADRRMTSISEENEVSDSSVKCEPADHSEPEEMISGNRPFPVEVLPDYRMASISEENRVSNNSVVRYELADHSERPITEELLAYYKPNHEVNLERTGMDNISSSEPARLGSGKTEVQAKLRLQQFHLGNTFSLKTIEAATRNFSRAKKLGKGGLFTVYKGILIDGREIAVKVIPASILGIEEFANNISTISSLGHPNLVSLLGHYLDDNRLMLIYNYMPNRSLDRSLFGKVDLRLTWPRSLEICLDIAKGLAFLHEETGLEIVHGDIKPSNIFLDEKFNTKISDIGFSKLDEANLKDLTEREIGREAYVAPEYFTDSLVTTKADIYSFGVVSLRIIIGTKTFTVDELHERLEIYGSFGKYPRKEAATISELLMLCTSPTPHLRPTASEIVKILEDQPSIRKENFLLRLMKGCN